MSDPKSVSFLCPQCGNPINAPRAYRGREVRCLACEQEVLVPPNAPAAAKTDAAHSDVSSKFAAGIFVMLFAIFYFTQCSELKAPKSPELIKEEGFASRVRVAVRVWMRENIADPEAEFTELRTEPGATSGIVDVLATIRGKNALGGYIFNIYQFEINSDRSEVISFERIK